MVIIITAATMKIGNSNRHSNTPIDNFADSTQTQTIESVSDTLYGGIQTPFSDFRITGDINKEDYPVIFSKDDKVGYKGKDGSIIAEPIYGFAHEFWYGVGRVRIDKDGEYIWKCIDINGNLYDYDEVYGFHYGVSPVFKDGKYGFINTAGELVVPLNYDKLYCAYADDARSTYAVRDDLLVYLNLTDGFEEVFEKYDTNKKAEYERTFDLKDFNITVVNDMLIVNGESDPTGFKFPMPILQNLDFDLYTQAKKLGTYKAKLIEGYYEGEFFVSFPEYDRPHENNNYEEYYATLNSANINYREVIELKETEEFMDTVKRYLMDNNIENTPFSIDIAFEGDFSGNGVTGAILQVNDTYRDGDIPKPFKENWTEKEFAESRTAFVNTILIIDDLDKPLEYRIVKSNLWTHTSWDYKTEDICFIANLDVDNQLELLISNGYYEYRDYSIVDLE